MAIVNEETNEIHLKILKKSFQFTVIVNMALVSIMQQMVFFLV